MAMHELLRTVSGWLVNHAQDSLLRYLTHSAVTLAIVGAVAWVGDRLLRRVGPQAQHRMWVTALLTGVVLPLLPAGWLAGLGSAHTNAVVGTATVTYHMVAGVVERWTLSPLVCSVVAAAYLLTMLFCIARLMWRWRRTWAMARRGAVLPLGDSACGFLNDAARRFGVGTPVVRCSGETRGPVVLGARRPLLLVPEGFFAAENAEDIIQTASDGDIRTASDGDIRTASDGDIRTASDADIAAALAHECAHIRRRDFAKNLIYECVAAAVAYHPACWLVRRRIAETRELVCDEMAAGAVGDRPEYAASLLRLATAMAMPGARASYAGGTPAIGVFDANILEERIMRLTTDLPKMSRTRRIAMTAVAACALLGGAMTATALSFDVTSQDAATAVPAQEKVYKIGNGVTPPLLTYSVDAEFTQKAKHAKYQGVSVVQCVVDAHGMPQHVHTVRKLGMGLDEKAIDAVRQYRFKPGTLDDKPVAVAITIEVNFHIY
jgi:TonB family protein